MIPSITCRIRAFPGWKIACCLLAGCLPSPERDDKPVLSLEPLQASYAPGDTVFFEGTLQVGNAWLHHVEIRVSPESWRGGEVVVEPLDGEFAPHGMDLDLRRHVGAGLALAGAACGGPIELELMTHLIGRSEAENHFLRRKAMTSVAGPACD